MLACGLNGLVIFGEECGCFLPLSKEFAKLNSFGLIPLAEEISKQPSIDSFV